MSMFQDFGSTLESKLESAEATADQDFGLLLADAKKDFGNLLALGEKFLPSQLKVLSNAFVSNAGILVSSPGAYLAAVASTLVAQELVWWDAVEPELQADVLSTLATLYAQGIALVEPAAAPAEEAPAAEAAPAPEASAETTAPEPVAAPATDAPAAADPAAPEPTAA